MLHFMQFQVAQWFSGISTFIEISFPVSVKLWKSLRVGQPRPGR